MYPKLTPQANVPTISKNAQSLARGVLGTIPVEKDGSAYFEMPSSMPVYFQALDKHGRAVQSMRSATYLHPGETLSCMGCHEHKRVSYNLQKKPIAFTRKPSIIKPEVEGAYPLSFPRLVQGVLDKNCVECHKKNKQAPSFDKTILSGKKDKGWTVAYKSLAGKGKNTYLWGKSGGNGSFLNDDTKGLSIPGKVGAYASKLFNILEKGHHDVKLSKEDMYRITLWLDCNSNFYGAYYDIEKQAKGELVLPKLK